MAREQHHPRRRGQTPWLAFMSVIVISVCMLLCPCIIVITNNVSVLSWPLQPSVILAILSSILNLASTVVLSKGVDVTWWRNVQHGTTLTRLHLIWAKGRWLKFPGPILTLSSGWDVNKVAWASIIVAIAAFIENPLLQRATHTRYQTTVSNDTLKLNISPQFPSGWAGTYYGTLWSDIAFSRDAVPLARQWFENSTLETENEASYTCSGTCVGNVLGAGLSTHCTSATQTIGLGASTFNEVFGTFFEPTLVNGSIPVLNFTTSYVSAVDDGCQGILTTETCLIRTAHVAYPIKVQNTTLSLDTARLPDMPIISEFSDPGDVGPPKRGEPAGPLVTVAVALFQYFSSSGSMNRTADGSTYLSFGGILASQYLSLDSNITYPLTCGLWWNSPRSYILNAMHGIEFRAAFRAGNPSTVQTFDVHRTKEELIFESDFRYLGGALAMMVVAVVTVVPLLWGWWQLGRSTSLSPVETAVAFGAPTLRHCGDELEIEDLLKRIGDTMVVYDQTLAGTQLRRTIRRTDEEVALLGGRDTSSSLTLFDLAKGPRTRAASASTRIRSPDQSWLDE